MSKWRLLFIKLMLLVMIAALVWRLYDMQIINGKGYKNLSDQRISANITTKAPRGEITDTNGKVLVTNRKGYSIKLQKTSITDADFNAMLLRLFNILEPEGVILADTLPMTAQMPFEMNFDSEEKKAKWFDENKKLAPDSSAGEMWAYIKKVYELEGYDDMTARKIAGLRSDIRNSGFSINSPYVLADDVSAAVVSKLKERQEEFPGLAVTQDYYREYKSGRLGAHFLGNVGKIYREEYTELKDKGYAMSDLVGKGGIEKICEDYLRGTDGSKNVFYGEDSGLLGDNESDVPAVPGNYVMLTIDADLQKAAEESLERNIKSIAESGKDQERKGGDADSGAAVVINVKNGDILALASYPGYDLSTYNQSYNELLNDEAKPLWNRAISGTYTPGSTFKPLTAIAALSTGVITANEKIKCEGVYNFYQDYQPKCWIWSEQRKTHEQQNVSDAIVNSCNYFFYETGRRMGIGAIDEYAKRMGLSEKTGIELTEEAKGNVAGPDYKKTLYDDPKEQHWVAGDTIQTAIGQSYTSVTPIALANYAATIANGGTRYRTHIIKEVHSSVDGTLVHKSQPSIAADVNISPDILEAVRRGMLGVTDEGSAKQIFSDYPVSVGGKTGTAQISKKASNNALFISFAPFDEPEIAVAVVIEHGFRGANAAYVARDIYNEYFGLNQEKNDEQNGINTEGLGIYSELLP